MSSSRSFSGPEVGSLPRVLLTFKLSDTSQMPDLLREFALHDDVVARADRDGVVLTVETGDSTPAMWDVRATVGMFDDQAVEVTQAAGDVLA